MRPTTTRKSYSCVECSRRKLRCSKNIPCSACVDRGIGHLCRRRQPTDLPNNAVRERSEANERSSENPIPHAPVSPSTTSSHAPAFGTSGLDPSVPKNGLHSTAFTRNTPTSSSPAAGRGGKERIVDHVEEDAGVVLEFLALSRQRISQAVRNNHDSDNSNNSTSHTTLPTSQCGHAVSATDLVFSVSQVRNMMAYHTDRIAWTHNVVHMPTFCEQCETAFSGQVVLERAWLAVYYAMVAVREKKKKKKKKKK